MIPWDPTFDSRSWPTACSTLMYILAVAGTISLVAARVTGARGGTASEILRLASIGFGVWHVVDAVLSHWFLGLHRIRMDSEMPLAWDLGWLIVSASGRWCSQSYCRVAAGVLAGVGQRNADANETIIVFRPGISQAAMMQAVVAADARLKWADASGTVWAMNDVSWSGLATLHARGALVVSSTPVLAGCLAWTQVAQRSIAAPIVLPAPAPA